MSDYEYYLESAKENCPERSELPENPFESAMETIEEDADRRYWAEWAARRQAGKEDPMWTIIEMVYNLSLILQRIVREFRETAETAKQASIAESERQQAQLKQQGTRLQEMGQRLFREALEDLVAELPATIRGVTAAQVSHEVRSMLDSHLRWLIGLATAGILVIGGMGGGLGYHLGSQMPPPLSPNQQELLLLGEQVAKRYQQLDDAGQTQLRSLMGWTEPQ
jgi:hypothetical protein